MSLSLAYMYYEKQFDPDQLFRARVRAVCLVFASQKRWMVRRHGSVYARS